MRCRTKKLGVLLLIAVLAMAAVGCSVSNSAESLFALPRIPVEYTGLQQRLNALLADGYEYISPTGGSSMQPVQMVDLDSDGQEEAVAFLRRASDEQPLKIMVFRTDGDSFAPYCTIASGGTSAESVSYRDYNGDGKLEITVGWRIGADVQTVAVYALGNGEATTLMQSSYARFAVDDLDSNGLFDLLLIRADRDGRSMAEHYRWQEGSLRVSGSCRLSSTLAELRNGSIVCGKADSQTKAAFITGINDKSVAMTDILTYRDGRLTNVSADPTTGLTEISYHFNLLRPQDINGDGAVEIPYPAGGNSFSFGGLFSWKRYDGQGNSIWAMDTYHNTVDNWYLVLNEDWHGRMDGTMCETSVGSAVVTVRVDGNAVLELYTFTGENREQEAKDGGRTVLTQRTDSVYAMRIPEAGAEYGVSPAWVESHFYLISTAWMA